MKLVMFQPKAGGRKARAGALLGGRGILDLSHAAKLLGMRKEQRLLGSLHSMLSDWKTSLELAKTLARKAAEGLGAAIREMKSVELRAPLTSPGKLICPGLNFSEHVEESKGTVGGKPAMPIAFVKFPTAVLGPDQPLPLPTGVRHVDYEIEVALVISRRAKNVSRGEALENVAGYMILNDISARDVQFEEMRRGMLLLGKNFDGFAPIGPWLVTADEVPDPQALGMELWIEGEKEPRQKSDTGKMIFSFAELIEYWSQMTLEPGDVISSGTPSGVAAFRKPDPEPWYLKAGQVMLAKVEKLGLLRTPVVSADSG